MALAPKLPPGRSNRKALAYTAEIRQLRATGYTFEAIRLALLDAGLKVSRTTIKREVAKRLVVAPSAQHHPATQPSPSQPALAPARASALHPPKAALPTPGSFVGDSRSGKEIVEAFMQGRITNPLLQRTSHESRSD